LANIAAMYAVFHGPKGLRSIAERIHGLTRTLDEALTAQGLAQTNSAYFDTLRIERTNPEAIRTAAEAAGINFRYTKDGAIGISLDETTTIDDVSDIVKIFTSGKRPLFKERPPLSLKAPISARRTSEYLTHPVFNTHHSETQMMRYIRSLER